MKLVQQSDQLLPIPPSSLLRFVQQAATIPRARSLILLPELYQVLLPRVHVHSSSVAYLTPLWVTSSFGSTSGLLVTF